MAASESRSHKSQVVATAQSNTTAAISSLLFSLLLHGSKRKHALAKVLLSATPEEADEQTPNGCSSRLPDLTHDNTYTLQADIMDTYLSISMPVQTERFPMQTAFSVTPVESGSHFLNDSGLLFRSQPEFAGRSAEVHPRRRQNHLKASCQPEMRLSEQLQNDNTDLVILSTPAKSQLPEANYPLWTFAGGKSQQQHFDRSIIRDFFGPLPVKARRDRSGDCDMEIEDLVLSAIDAQMADLLEEANLREVEGKLDAMLGL